MSSHTIPYGIVVVVVVVGFSSSFCPCVNAHGGRETLLLLPLHRWVLPAADHCIAVEEGADEHIADSAAHRNRPHIADGSLGRGTAGEVHQDNQSEGVGAAGALLQNDFPSVDGVDGADGAASSVAAAVVDLPAAAVEKCSHWGMPAASAVGG